MDYGVYVKEYTMPVNIGKSEFHGKALRLSIFLDIFRMKNLEIWFS